MKKFYLETYGCKSNQADSELMRGILAKEFKEASVNEADFIILNSCGVVKKTERKIIKRMQQFKKMGKKIVLAGCLPLISPKTSKNLANGVLGPTNIFSLPIVVKRVLKNKKSIFFKPKKIDKAKFYCQKKKEKKENCSTVISISEGCLGECSYCVTKLARGRLKTFEMEYVLNEIRNALVQGFKEIQLTSQDLAIYGVDKGKFLFPKLLKEISKINADFKIRLGMMNPWGAKKILRDLISVLKSKKFYKFLHLPLQSGDDEILRKMNRNYTTKDFLRTVNVFRENFKESLLATDVICAYPDESEESFEKTIDLVKKTKPEILHIFRFSKRQGTEAEKLKDFPERIKKERSRILTKIWTEMNLKKNKKFLGKKFNVLITEKRGNSFLARTNSFRAVILKEGKIGKFEKVKIINFRPNYLIGRII
ncbi:threonylcarbamoyladenosine tRNA methylthiotransferase [Parcubacteria bacterium DG_74_2]|nr:MAG: threonylcarbamoyladenosine tRNA methylthiotransferase [Parcubacteria bacterium DG_74_2]